MHARFEYINIEQVTSIQTSGMAFVHKGVVTVRENELTR